MKSSTWLATLGVALLGASCSDSSTVVVSSQNLNRPVDVAFACYGGLRVNKGAQPDKRIISSAQPTASCEARSVPRKTADAAETRPPDQEDSTTDGTVGTAYWYSLILESVPGTVAIATWNSKPSSQFSGADVAVLDTDPLTPGKNAISIGELPVAIATDRSGCFAVTANAGSCDISTLSINSVLDTTSKGPEVKRIPVRNGMNAPILAKPATMVGGLALGVNDIGDVCPAKPTGQIYIAYPSCNLVATIEIATDAQGDFGKIVGAISYDTGTPRVLSGEDLAGVSCPAECGDTVGAAKTGSRPQTLAFRHDRRVDTAKLAIGLDKVATPKVSVVDIDKATGLPAATVAEYALETLTDASNNVIPLGVTSIALSPQIGNGGMHPAAPLPDLAANDPTDGLDESGTQVQYVYAVSTDTTVRVVDVLNVKRECNTQVDTRYLRDPSLGVDALACLPLADPAFPRRPGARGPGISLVGDTTSNTTSAGVPTEVGVPLSVAFFKAVPQYSVNSDTDANVTLKAPAIGPSNLYGHFAAITSTNGAAFVVNVDDDNNARAADSTPDTDTFVATFPQGTAPVTIIPHQLRDFVVTRGDDAEAVAGSGANAATQCTTYGTTLRAGPRATTAPAATITAGTFQGAFATTKLGELPTLRQVQCPYDNSLALFEMLLPNTSAARDALFPDLRGMSDEDNWTLIWEGALSNDSVSRAIDGPIVRTGQMSSLNAETATLTDASKPFCGMGVESGDVVQFRGCDPANTSSCPTGYTCYVHAESQVPIATSGGVCMPTNEADRLANACRDFLLSLRRYTVSKSEAGTLSLRPRKHELRTSPIDGCESDTQCKALADYAVQNTQSGIAAVTDAHTYACMADSARPATATGKRCIQTCTSNASCDTGMICQKANPNDANEVGTCMEGVFPPQACVNGPQRFEVRAGEAFTVIGDRTGYIHPLTKSPTSDACVVDPASSLIDRGRIPLKAPACGDPETTNPITGALPGGGFEPNPCSTTVAQFDAASNGGDCSGTTLKPRQAPAIKLRTRSTVITMVDPYYVGDQSCPLDRGGFSNPAIGASTRVPLVFPGYSLAYHLTSGYTPMTLGNNTLSFNPVFPVRVVEGPTHSIWVVDAGDYLSSSYTTASTEGAVYRVESSTLSIVNILN